MRKEGTVSNVFNKSHGVVCKQDAEHFFPLVEHLMRHSIGCWID